MQFIIVCSLLGIYLMKPSLASYCFFTERYTISVCLSELICFEVGFELRCKTVDSKQTVKIVMSIGVNLPIVPLTPL